jgi:hypothetical protein
MFAGRSGSVRGMLMSLGMGRVRGLGSRAECGCGRRVRCVVLLGLGTVKGVKLGVVRLLTLVEKAVKLECWNESF